MAINTPFDPIPDSPPDSGALGTQSAAELIRQKVADVYGDEPNAAKELNEANHLQRRSKHQQFMYELGASGKDLATIQTEWHNYYQGLPAAEKHKVWEEFYSSQSAITKPASEAHQLSEHKQQAARPRAKAKKLRDVRSTKDIQETIRHTVSAGGKLETKHHLQSLLFGLGMGFLVLVIFLFGFFNEVIIAPFIQPSRVAASTPLIVSTDSVAPTATPEVIIPKINVEIPVVYGQTSIDENVIENALESGVVHYPTTTLPGQNGNAAFFGHSSNNIFNKGKYKFAFVLLHTLEIGDTFYLTRDSKVYVYKVFSKTVVDPSEVGVLNPVPGKNATATLITCDPPGTSLRRLVVVGEQISPDPAGNTESTATAVETSDAPFNLVGNGPTLWGRFISTLLGKLMVGLLVIGCAVFILRKANSQLSKLVG
jgi:sortase A